MKNIYLLVGPSGAGKSSIARELSRRYGMKEVCSYTERPPRSKDEPGHIFVTPEQFDAAGEMSAYTVYNGYRYGVPQRMIDDSDLYVIDPAGVRYLTEHYRGCKGIVVIAVWIPAAERRKRMLMRGDPLDAVRSRLRTDLTVFSALPDMSDIMIRNDALDVSVDAVKAYIDLVEQRSGGFQ